MSVSYNPSVPSNGLLFYYDMDNTKKSWFGAPTTNYIWKTEELSDSGYWSNTNLTITANSTLSPIGDLTADKLVSASASGSLLAQSANVSDTGTGILTASIYAKDFNSTGYFTFNCYYNGDTEVNIDFFLSGNGSTNNPAGAAISYVGNGWYRCSMQIPARVNAGTLVLFRFWPNGRGVTTAGTGCYFWGAQLEKGSFVTPYIKANVSNATRSSTNNVADILGKSTTVSTLTYNAANEFSFNGTTNYIYSSPIEPANITISAWFKATGAPSTNDSAGGDIVCSNPQFFGTAVQYVLAYSWANSRVLFLTQANTSVLATSDGAVSQNTIHHAVATFDGATQNLYIDGVLLATRAYTTAIVYPTTGDRNLQIGRWGYAGYERYFNGSIYSVAIYNRAITADEVKQAFNAKRERYGI